ncbi:MAG: HoxN/HupN/NixA family nickel/cobalt transporter [Steroidobacteraceae bacterium]
MRFLRYFEPEMRRSIGTIYAVLFAINLAAWGWAVFAFRHHPLLLGTALLAYGFGLRHAVDADHIAAIDNVTRKLMQQRTSPVTVGFFFAMGHSTVVILACVAIAVAASDLLPHWGVGARAVGGLISTCVSAGFLLLIAVVNLVIFRAVWRTFQHVRRGGAYVDEDFDLLLNGRGFTARIFRPLFRLVSKSWHMYPLGFLFGLGFDTATEVALLAISGSQAAHGTSIWLVLVFPALFAAGMSLVDSTDGILMLGAYQWAFVKPVRKLFYNMAITAVSVAVALGIGSIEALGLLESSLRLSGGFWDGVAALNGNFNGLGFLIIAIFIAAWLVSVLIYRYKGFDQLEISQIGERSSGEQAAPAGRPWGSKGR